MSPAGSLKRKADSITAAGLTADWMAYQEVYGSNGLAAGGIKVAADEEAPARDADDVAEAAAADADDAGDDEPPPAALLRDIAMWAP